MGPLVPRPAITAALFVLLTFLGANLYFDADKAREYDGTMGTLVLGGLIAGIFGFELVVGLIRRGRTDDV